MIFRLTSRRFPPLPSPSITFVPVLLPHTSSIDVVLHLMGNDK